MTRRSPSTRPSALDLVGSGRRCSGRIPVGGRGVERRRRRLAWARHRGRGRPRRRRQRGGRVARRRRAACPLGAPRPCDGNVVAARRRLGGRDGGCSAAGRGRRARQCSRGVDERNAAVGARGAPARRARCLARRRRAVRRGRCGHRPAGRDRLRRSRARRLDTTGDGREHRRDRGARRDRPLLTAVRIPARAAARPVAFAVRPAAWSAPLVGAPAWRFGDGATASGPSVAHTAAARGAFTVTVNQSDAAGGVSARTARVKVVAVADVVRPSIAGSANVGSTLTCRKGTWRGVTPIQRVPLAPERTSDHRRALADVRRASGRRRRAPRLQRHCDQCRRLLDRERADRARRTVRATARMDFRDRARART